jgi:multimeric flavodoxin WrbA
MADAPGETRTLLIVWWSMTGGTAQLAEAAREGASKAASEAGREAARLEVSSIQADRAQPSHVLAAAGYVFCTPENLGSMSGMLKDFFDRCYYPALDRVNGRPYASIVCAGSDGQGAVRQIDRIATGWRLRPVAPPLIVCTHAQTPEAILAQKRIAPAELARARELGEGLAAGLAMGLW